MEDKRFAHIARDPKFRKIPKSERKVKIDKRFKSMFTDKRFSIKYTVDKRGRPVNQTSQENYKKFYDIESSDEDSVEEESDASEQTEKNEEVKSKKVKSKEQKQSKKKDLKGLEKSKSEDVGSEENEQTEEGSASEEDAKSKKVKSKKNKQSKKKDSKALKKSKSEDAGSKENEQTEEGSASEEDDANFSSNGKLLLIKQSIESDQDSNTGNNKGSDVESDKESTDEEQNELSENEKQLKLKSKSEKKLDDDTKRKLRDLTVDYARGEGVLYSDSSSDEESSEYEEDDDDIEHAWGELDKEAETTDEITHRLAACSMDWDRIRAMDLMILFNSFLPPEGIIKSVTIYPSEFGLQRMKEEELKGPAELVDSNENKSDEEEDEKRVNENEEGSSYHMEKLRKYQLNRLKYYYAVIVFDSANTANKIYKECDGLEYESSSTKLDLRFIPDEVTFDQEPREVCTKLPDLTKYTPRLFTTTALQQVKVNLTWDETNPERQEFSQKLKSGNLDNIDQSDIQAYVASGTSDEESEDEVKKHLENIDEADKGEKVEVYKSLLKSITKAEEDKKKKEVELEFTWGIGVKEKTEKMIKENEKMKQKESLTPFEQYLEKRKEKKKTKRELKKKQAKGGSDEESDSEDSIPSDIDMNDPYFAEEMKNMQPKAKKRKKTSKNSDLDSADEDEEKKQEAELELLLMDENEESNKRHFDMKRIEEAEALSKSKKKRLSKRKKDLKDEAGKDDFEVDVKDPRFAELYTSHLFNIDPTDPNYRKTKGTEDIIKEKFKRKDGNNTDSAVTQKSTNQEQNAEQKKSQVNRELNTLINSIKRNTKNINKCIK